MSNDLWAEALQEAETPDLRDKGLWARCFAEADGDEQRARAAYVRLKVAAASPSQAPAPTPAPPATPNYRGDFGHCPKCGKSVRKDATFCFYCDATFGPTLRPLPEPPALAPAAQPAQHQLIKTAKSRGVYIILGLFLGLLGIHNFYAGRFAYGVMQLLITAVLGWFVIGLFITAIWVIVELFVVTEDGAGDAFA